MHGNGVLTRYAYDDRTFRLRRLRSERCTMTDLTIRPDPGTPAANRVFQDFGYDDDLVGNITILRDRTPGSGILNTKLGPDALDRVFRYDPLYRLISATGRECDAPPSLPWADAPRGTDPKRTRGYAEQYDYDAVGNLLQLRHQAATGSANRVLQLGQGNRLADMRVGKAVYTYAYDAAGNLIQENTDRHFEWDHADRMRAFRIQTPKASPRSTSSTSTTWPVSA
jgi:YD repeat-containing protein